jgi:hypothetical protein
MLNNDEMAALIHNMPLHQLRREHRDQGRIIATIERAGDLVDPQDYLLLDIYAAEVADRRC